MGTRQKAIIVLGMHRSGTSALAGLISKFGVYVGKRLAPPVEGVNPRGFWEHPGIVAIHDHLLGQLGRPWSDPRALPESWWSLPEAEASKTALRQIVREEYLDQRLWMMKDPRTCRLLPMWYRVLEEEDVVPCLVLSLRHPLAVSVSLARRDGFSLEHGCMLWIVHVLQSELETRDRTRAFVYYDDLVLDPGGVMRTLASRLNLAGELASEGREGSFSFIDPNLRHHSAEVPDSGHPALRLAAALYECIREHGTSDQWLATLGAEFEQLMSHTGPWLGLHALRIAAAHDHDRVNAELAECRAEVARVKGSLGWRLAGPLRLAVRGLKRRQVPNSRGGN